MSQKRRRGNEAKLQAYAPVFAALGDETRLSLVDSSRPGTPGRFLS